MDLLRAWQASAITYVNAHDDGLQPGRLRDALEVPAREYRLTVEGELSDRMAAAFAGMTFKRTQGKTVLIGPVRDQAELQGILQRVSSLGLTLLSAAAVDEAEERCGACGDTRPGRVARTRLDSAMPRR